MKVTISRHNERRPDRSSKSIGLSDLEHAVAGGLQGKIDAVKQADEPPPEEYMPKVGEVCEINYKGYSWVAYEIIGEWRDLLWVIIADHAGSPSIFDKAQCAIRPRRTQKQIVIEKAQLVIDANKGTDGLESLFDACMLSIPKEGE